MESVASYPSVEVICFCFVNRLMLAKRANEAIRIDMGIPQVILGRRLAGRRYTANIGQIYHGETAGGLDTKLRQELGQDTGECPSR